MVRKTTHSSPSSRRFKSRWHLDSFWCSNRGAASQFVACPRRHNLTLLELSPFIDQRRFSHRVSETRYNMSVGLFSFSVDTRSEAMQSVFRDAI